MNATQLSTLPFCLPLSGSSVCAWITAAPALMHATPSSMISLAKTGIRGWTLRVEAPLTATSIQVFLAMFPPLAVGFSAFKPRQGTEGQGHDHPLVGRVRELHRFGFAERVAVGAQMAQFTLLPSFLLSGFMFPFKGMPVWAQCAGEVFPVTHALRIVRGVLLKGNGVAEIVPEVWPIAAFALVITVTATWSYPETLDGVVASRGSVSLTADC